LKFRIGGFFKFKERNLLRGFLSWRERRKRDEFLRFYLRQPGEDNRSFLGKKLDLAGWLLLAWLAGFLLLAKLTGRPAAALALSLPLLAAEALLLRKLATRREQRRRTRRRLWLAGQKFMENILKMDPRKEFIPYVRDILAGLPGFQGVELTAGRKKKDTAGPGIDLTGSYRGVPVAVRCVRRAGDAGVTPEDVRAFAGVLDPGGYKNGLFITTGDFSPGVSAVVEEAARGGIKIKLIDRYRLMDLARQAGTGAFRTEDTSAGAAPGKRKVSLAALRDAAFGSRKKAKSYFLYGLLLYGGYLLLKGGSGLSLVYLFFAALNFTLGAGCLCFGKSPAETDPLEGLEPDK